MITGILIGAVLASLAAFATGKLAHAAARNRKLIKALNIMSNFNKVILAGNITRDPELRHTPSGTAVAELGIAINRSWFNKSTNKKNEETTFVDVTLWGKTAEIAAEYLTKGRSVLIEGRLQLDTWQDKETGKNRSKLKVVGENLQMLGGKQPGPDNTTTDEKVPF